jgi:hypothetical protein
MGQLLSSPRTRYATRERRRRKDALKSKQSTINEPLHPDYDYYHWVSGGSPERLGNGQTASRSVIPKPHQGDRKSASSRASHPTSVHTTSRVKEDVSSKSDGHQTRKNTSKKPKSGHIKTKKAGESNAKHKSISRQDSHHDGHTDKKKEKRECVVCTDTLSLHRFPDRPPTTHCKHKVDVCRKCLRTWITSEFDTKMWDDIKCPVCSTLMQKGDMRHFAPKDIFKRYSTPFSTHHHLVPPPPLTAITGTSSSAAEQNRKHAQASHGAIARAAKPAKCISPTRLNSGAIRAKRRHASFTT